MSVCPRAYLGNFVFSVHHIFTHVTDGRGSVQGGVAIRYMLPILCGWRHVCMHVGEEEATRQGVYTASDSVGGGTDWTNLS